MKSSVNYSVIAATRCRSACLPVHREKSISEEDRLKAAALAHRAVGKVFFVNEYKWGKEDCGLYTGIVIKR